MKLTKDQCVQLDNILKAFGNNDSLSREELLDIFDQNDQLAYSYVHILVNNRLVSESSKAIGSDLPLMIFKESPTVLFMANGGFEAEYDKAAVKIQVDNSLQELQKKNIELQNESLSYQQTIRKQEARIRNFEEQNKPIELLKNYWWLIGSAFALGAAIAKFLFK